MYGGITVREASRADIGRIVEIERLGFDYDIFSRRQFVYLMSKAKGAFYVAIREGEVAGYLSLLVNVRGDNLRLYAIAVDPKFRRSGIAAALMDKTLEYAGREGKAKITLEVKTDNTAAIRLYEKYGFRISQRKKEYYSDRSDAYAMVLRLR